jgi:DNA-binding response OmpR family regulator
MSGYQVCQAIRKNPATGVLPIMLVTALDPNEERIKGLEAGADDFLVKAGQPTGAVRAGALAAQSEAALPNG